MDTIVNKTCETCGNNYEQAFVVQLPSGARHVFDSFECAINRLAPSCGHCGCRIIGHGVDQEGEMFCCESCVRMARRELGTPDSKEDRLVSVAAAESFPASDPPATSPGPC